MENIDTKLLEIWYHNPTIVFNWFKLCNLKHKQRTVTFYTSVYRVREGVTSCLSPPW